MTRGFLAQVPHPHYPGDWLSEPEAIAFLKEHGYEFRKLYADFCRKNLELGGSEGNLYISKRSLERYVKHRLIESVQGL